MTFRKHILNTEEAGPPFWSSASSASTVRSYWCQEGNLGFNWGGYWSTQTEAADTTSNRSFTTFVTIMSPLSLATLSCFQSLFSRICLASSYQQSLQKLPLPRCLSVAEQDTSLAYGIFLNIFLLLALVYCTLTKYGNKIPQMGRLKQQKFIFSALESRSPRSKCLQS